MTDDQEAKQQPHRPGLFKVPAKKHSTGRHRSKRTIAKEQKGKVGVKTLSVQKRRALSKMERRQRSAQLRAHKSAKLMEQRRQEGGAPLLATVISMDSARSAEQLVQMLMEADPEAVGARAGEHGHGSSLAFHLNVPRFRSRYTFLCPNSADPSLSSIFAILDAIRASDLLLLFWPLGTECLLASQEQLLATILAQGMPTTVNAVAGMPKSGKQRETARKQLEKAMKGWHKERNRVHDLDTSSDALQLLRQMSAMRKSHSTLQRQRPYLLAEHIKSNDSDQMNNCTLQVSGYLRGTPLSVNKLVHLPGWGDFQLARIDQTPDPHPLKQNARNEMFDGTTTVLARPDSDKLTPLDSEIVPDPMDSEQPWPEEEHDSDDKLSVPKVKKRVPAGTSEYQASWLIDDDDEQDDESGDDDEDEERDEDSDDESEADSLSVRREGFEERMEDEDEGGRGEKDDAKSEVTESEQMDDDDNDECNAMDEAERERFRLEREHLQWPDEVETPRDVPARQRFQRYRGLKSFRTSPWDPKENLPRDYGRIYKIVDFKRTRKLALAEARAAFEVVESGEFAHPGMYVTLHIANVPRQLIDTLNPACPLVVYGLLRHEHRMSVLNMVLQKHASCSAVIKSKDQLVFQVGCRRFSASPLFSQHTNGHKFKLERFMPHQGAFCATVYAPITYPPANVCVFRQLPHTTQLQLAAFGMVLDVNPDRVVLKRTVLSGHPYKVNKRTAVVRYMFYNREDVEWFKPVELYTHGGRRGRIKQALGTHGLLKCVFDQPLSVQDSVLLNLYKRVYPKWNFDSRLSTNNNDLCLALASDDTKKKDDDNEKNKVGKEVHFERMT